MFNEYNVEKGTHIAKLC